MEFCPTFGGKLRACRIVCLPRSMYYYQSVKDDSEVVGKLNELAERYPTRGFDNYYGKIRNQDLIWNCNLPLLSYILKLNISIGFYHHYLVEMWETFLCFPRMVFHISTRIRVVLDYLILDEAFHYCKSTSMRLQIS